MFTYISLSFSDHSVHIKKTLPQELKKKLKIMNFFLRRMNMASTSPVVIYSAAMGDAIEVETVRFTHGKGTRCKKIHFPREIISVEEEDPSNDDSNSDNDDDSDNDDSDNDAGSERLSQNMQEISETTTGIANANGLKNKENVVISSSFGSTRSSRRDINNNKLNIRTRSKIMSKDLNIIPKYEIPADTQEKIKITNSSPLNNLNLFVDNWFHNNGSDFKFISLSCKVPGQIDEISKSANKSSNKGRWKVEDRDTLLSNKLVAPECDRLNSIFLKKNVNFGQKQQKYTKVIGPPLRRHFQLPVTNKKYNSLMFDDVPSKKSKKEICTRTNLYKIDPGTSNGKVRRIYVPPNKLMHLRRLSLRGSRMRTEVKNMILEFSSDYQESEFFKHYMDKLQYTIFKLIERRSQVENINLGEINQSILYSELHTFFRIALTQHSDSTRINEQRACTTEELFDCLRRAVCMRIFRLSKLKFGKISEASARTIQFGFEEIKIVVRSLLKDDMKRFTYCLEEDEIETLLEPSWSLVKKIVTAFLQDWPAEICSDFDITMWLPFFVSNVMKEFLRVCNSCEISQDKYFKELNYVFTVEANKLGL